MRLHTRLPVIGLGIIVFLIAFSGPLMGIVHQLHADPNIVGVGIGIGAALSILLVVFRTPIAAFVSLVKRKSRTYIDQLEDDGDEDGAYPALPRGREPLLDDIGYDPGDEHEHVLAAADTSYAPAETADEPTLQLAPNCPLPVSSALNHWLILEQSRATGRHKRSVATRLLVELFGQLSLPQLIITRNPSYVSVLPLMSEGWLAGSPEAEERRLHDLHRFAQEAPDLEGRYVAITEKNARGFAKKALGRNVQVVVDLATFADQSQAVRVLSRLLIGIGESGTPCILTIMEAETWLPNDRWLPSTADAQVVEQVRSLVLQLMDSAFATVILATDKLMPMDLRLVRKSVLWLLNMLPYDEDQPFLCFQSGLLPEGLANLQYRAILADVTTKTAMELVLARHQSPHEVQMVAERHTSGLLDDLADLTDEEEVASRLGK